jgi:post-segregation antitoxin (ccd killing protein)
MRGADAPVVKTAVDSDGKVVVDPAFLEEARDGVVDVSEHTAAGQVQDGEILRVGIVVA